MHGCCQWAGLHAGLRGKYRRLKGLWLHAGTMLEEVERSFDPMVSTRPVHPCLRGARKPEGLWLHAGIMLVEACCKHAPERGA